LRGGRGYRAKFANEAGKAAGAIRASEGLMLSSPDFDLKIEPTVTQAAAFPPDRPKPDERLAEPEKAARARRRQARGALFKSLVGSGLLHAAAIAAIVLLGRGPAIQGAQQTPEVELVAEQPPAGEQSTSDAPPAASAASAANAAAKPSADAVSHGNPLRKPPPEPAAARAAKPAQKPQQHAGKTPASATKAPAKTTIAAVSPNGEAAASSAADAATGADPSTALPFFSMPSSFASNVLNGQGDQGDSYKGLVFGRVARAKRYPDSARARGESGQAIVAFTVDDSGALTSVSLAQSSGFADLDAEALAMVRQVAPFPPPPPGADRSFAAAIAFGEK
jgi:TonB family protein